MEINMVLGYYPTEHDAKMIYDAVSVQLRKDGPFPMRDQKTQKLQGHITKVELDGLRIIAVVEPESDLLPIFIEGSIRDVSIRKP